MEEKKKTIRLIENPTTFKLVIPEPVEAKIRHLCSKVYDVEWSGTLFYKVEGSLDDGTFQATCLDICVMDIGNSTFTDFDDNEDIIAYRVNHPELLQENVYEGLIHSHNKMATFFSGTDVATLKQEGETLNHFLSLIVNNEGTYTAKITRKIFREIVAEAKIKYTEQSYYNTFQNVRVDLSKDKKSEAERTEKKEETLIEVFTFSINKESSPERFTEVDRRLEAIKYRKRTPARTVFPTTTVFGNFNQRPASYWNLPDNTSAKYQTNSYKSAQPKKTMGTGYQTPTPLCLLESFNPDIIKDLCAQLLTGSIFANDKMNLELWVKGMDARYTKKFGDLDDEQVEKRLGGWIEAMVLHLIYTPDKDLENRCLQKYGTDYNEDDFSEVCAYDMIRFLMDLPDSKVKEMMLNELSNYLPDDVSEYF